MNCGQPWPAVPNPWNWLWKLMNSPNREYPVSMFQIGKVDRRLESRLKETEEIFVRTEHEVDKIVDKGLVI